MERHEKAAALRAVLGPEPTEATLYALLAQHNDDVNASVNSYFGDPAQPAQSTQSPAEGNLFHVTVPAGSAAGATIHVQTPAGLMQVQVPVGLTGGDSFLMRLPPPSAIPVAPAVPAYPGAANQPRVNIVHRQPPPIIVHARPYGPRPYYGGYYGDPFLAGGMGLLGGMLVADALFW